MLYIIVDGWTCFQIKIVTGTCNHIWAFDLKMCHCFMKFGKDKPTEWEALAHGAMPRRCLMPELQGCIVAGMISWGQVNPVQQNNNMPLPWWGCASECLTPWSWLGQKKTKIPTLCRTTPYILGPCLGQRTKYTLSRFTQWCWLISDLGLLNTV